MSNRLFFIFFLLSTITVSAQQVPNGSFYYWGNSYTPDGWGTWASAIGGLNSASAASLSKLASRDTTAFDYTTDSAALRLTVDTVTLPSQGIVTLSGFASLGGASYVPPPMGQGLQFGYLHYSAKPDTLYFDYMFSSPLASDSAALILNLTGFDTIAGLTTTYLSATWLLPVSNQWVRNVALPLYDLYNPQLSDYPDSLQLIFYASVASSLQRGSTLWVDSLHFDASVNPVMGIDGIKNAQKGIYTYPNPAAEEFNIVVPDEERRSTLHLYDATGLKVLSQTLADRQNRIDIELLPSGTYTLLIISTDRLTRYRGVVTIFK